MHRTKVGPEGSRTEVLVDWEGLPHEELTWEQWSNLVKLFLELDLEGKVILEGELNYTNSPNPNDFEGSNQIGGRPVAPDRTSESPPVEGTSVGHAEELG